MSLKAEVYTPANTLPTDLNNIQNLMNSFPLQIDNHQNVRSQDTVVDWITPEEFEELLENFIQKKTEKFQAKALITRETYNDAISALQVRIVYSPTRSSLFIHF